MQIQGTVGQPASNASGSTPNLRLGNLGDLIQSQLHGRYYEQAVRGNLFRGGMTLTSISNVIWSTQLDATTKPITGIWNPTTSGVNAVILKATLGVAVTNATSLGGGPYVWATSTANAAISTGTTPLSMSNLVATGSRCKDMSGIALTGMTGAITVKFGSALNGGSGQNYSFVGTAAGPVTFAAGINEENLDGSIIVPPGGVLALLATTTPVAHSAVSGILWEEVPV
jgi:hypothetical protein